MVLYDKEYYNNYCSDLPYDRNRQEWLDFFGNVADWIAINIKPQKVLDVGCAKGFLVEALRDRGIECYGIDISEYAISQVRDDIKPYCKVSSILDPFPETYYDLITCIEVLEHLPERQAKHAVANLCAHSNDIIISSTSKVFNDKTHLNVRPNEYWIKLFSDFGFYKDPFFDGSFISPDCMRFKKRIDGSVFKVGFFSIEALFGNACGIIRVLSPLSACKLKFGINITSCLSVFQSRTLKIINSAIHNSNIIIFQRDCAIYLTKLSEYLHKKNKVLIYEIDDLLWNIPPNHPSYNDYTSLSPYIIKAMEYSDVITVSTDELKRNITTSWPALSRKVVILPNYIDTTIWDDFNPTSRNDSKIKISFVGTPTHTEDLSIIEDAIGYIIRKYEHDVSLEIWGGNSPKGLSIYSKGKFIPSYTEYAKTLSIEKPDIAIVPLADNNFNRCKSNIKWLEFGIIGTAGIYSNIEPYKCVKNGLTGILVNNDTVEWVQALEDMIKRPKWREFIAAMTKHEILQNYTIQQNCFKWFDLYCSIWSNFSEW